MKKVSYSVISLISSLSGKIDEKDPGSPSILLFRDFRQGSHVVFFTGVSPLEAKRGKG